jgi:hypothetical protein
MGRLPLIHKTPNLFKDPFPQRPIVLLPIGNIVPEFVREVTILKLIKPFELGALGEFSPEVKCEEHERLGNMISC